MILGEFEQEIFAVAMVSPICGIPSVRRLTATAIGLRIDVVTDGFIDAFYNERTGTTAYALIHHGQRIFGADNTGGWHIHSFANPDQHSPISEPMHFAQFVAEIERQQPQP